MTARQVSLTATTDPSVVMAATADHIRHHGNKLPVYKLSSRVAPAGLLVTGWSNCRGWGGDAAVRTGSRVLLPHVARRAAGFTDTSAAGTSGDGRRPASELRTPALRHSHTTPQLRRGAAAWLCGLTRPDPVTADSADSADSGDDSRTDAGPLTDAGPSAALC